METVNIIIRIVHVGSAIVLLGGAVFVVLVLGPAMKGLEGEAREGLIGGVKRRFTMLAHAALLLLIATGAYNWVLNIEAYRAAPNKALLQGLLGFKVLLALAIVGIVFAQMFKAITACPTKVMRINVALGTAIVILAAIVRHLRLEAMAVAGGG